MDFFRGYISDLLRRPLTDYPPNQVVEVKPDEYLHHTPYHREDGLMVYGLPEGGAYEIVLHKDVVAKATQTAFSLSRTRDLSEAKAIHDLLVDILPPLCASCNSLVTVDSLQDICNYLREHPKQSLAHISAHFGFLECFKNSTVRFEAANMVCGDTGVTPLHLAVKSGRLNTVLTVLALNPNLDTIDKSGKNVLHYAAETSKEIISACCNALLGANANVNGQSNGSPGEATPDRGTKLIQLINAHNNEKASPIHLACLADKPDCVKELLKNGADVNGACIETRHPSDSNLENIGKLMLDQLDTKDMKNGGNPLHWARSPQCMETLIDKGCNVNAKNFQGESVLHVNVQKNRLPCIVSLLSHGSNVNAQGPNGNAPLHIAVRAGDVTIVQALVVFAAKLNAENCAGETPRHIAATAKRNTAQDTILYILHSVGSRRCHRSSQSSPCSDGCSAVGIFNGIPPESAPFQRISGLYDSLLGNRVVKAAVERKRKKLFKGNKDMMDIDEKDSDGEPTRVRLLSLDGGGIRGLLLIQMLSVLEDMMNMPAYEFFDWIAGTSTGGILALAMALGHNATECRQFYFQLKDKVFSGTRPYESEPLEKFLQKLMGEETTMADIIKPKVMVTATLADRFPADLQIFRNYKAPVDILGVDTSPKKIPIKSPKPSEVLVWAAARSSGAAPTYFRSCGRYLDGGLISNNPTLDAITEIVNHNAALQATGQDSKKVKLEVVVSLGTGGIPQKEVPIIDVFRPDSLYAVAKMAFMASSLGQLLADQASQSDGQVVERAKAWCSTIDVPYFRLNPPLSEDIALDETQNAKLVNMLWEATAYMHSRKEEFEELVLLLQ